MKKVLFALFALSTMASCNSGKTPEQITEEATKQFEAKKAALLTEADAACDAKKESLVATLSDSIVNADKPVLEVPTK